MTGKTFMNNIVLKCSSGAVGSADTCRAGARLPSHRDVSLQPGGARSTKGPQKIFRQSHQGGFLATAHLFLAQKMLDISIESLVFTGFLQKAGKKNIPIKCATPLGLKPCSAAVAFPISCLFDVRYFTCTFWSAGNVVLNWGFEEHPSSDSPQEVSSQPGSLSTFESISVLKSPTNVRFIGALYVSSNFFMIN